MEGQVQVDGEKPVRTSKVFFAVDPLAAGRVAAVERVLHVDGDAAVLKCHLQLTRGCE